MHTVRTKSLHQYNHPEFEIIVDLKKVTREILNDFVSHIQNSIAEGAKLDDSSHIQFGTNLLKVTSSDHGYLRFDEPNFKGLPIKFRPGVTNSLQSAERQRAFLQSYGLNLELLDPPSMQHSAFTSEDYKNCESLSLQRIEPIDENDSGWIITNESSPCNAHELSRTSLYEVLTALPEIKPWLGFPHDSCVKIDPNRINVSYLEETLSIQEDSPLANAKFD